MTLSWCWWVVVVAAMVVVVLATTVVTEEGRQQEGKPPASRDTTVVHQLEKSLLSMFGLKRRPSVTTNVQVPPYMLQLYHNMEAARDHDHYYYNTGAPNTVRSFTHKESEADARYPAHKMRYRFNVSNIPSEEELHGAELRLMHLRHPQVPESLGRESPVAEGSPQQQHRRLASKEGQILHRIKVYDVLRLATRKSQPVCRLLDTSVVDARHEGIQKLDVSDAIRRWVAEPHKNHGLLVEVVPLSKNTTVDTSHLRLRRSSLDHDWSKQQPLLVIHTNDGKSKHRVKRSNALKHKKGRSVCRRERLFVDFRRVGWDDWIVAPSGYDAYFCQGDCPFPLPDRLNATNHAVVQTLVNSRYPSRVPKACCVPTELSPISMLYMDDDDKFVLKNHQNMVVEGCGCR